METSQNAVQHTEPAGWRDFIVQLSHAAGGMLNGNRISLAAKQLLDAAPVESCKWFQEDAYDAADTYQSACGVHWTFMEGGPVHNRVKFCMGCGKPVAEIQAELEPLDE